MNYLLLRLLPKNIASRLAGLLMNFHLPAPLLRSLIRLYSRFYGINLAEAKNPIESFTCFNAFFTRELKKKTRPIDREDDSVVSPVDGTAAEFGEIQDGLLVQVKGTLYSMADLIGEKTAGLFEEGYFITIYLSPADYHRIHAPVAGKVSRFSYFSGSLWPVNRIGIEWVSGLFSLNERVVTPLETERGTIALVKIGATVVGKISLEYDNLTTNAKRNTSLNIPVVPSRNYEKGAEIGCFQLGSTVILLFQKSQIEPVNLYRNRKIKLGQTIARFLR